jgi:hypothetical protein
MVRRSRAKRRGEPGNAGGLKVIVGRETRERFNEI